MDDFTWMDSPSFDKALLEDLKIIEQRESANYDGVLGSLPKWVPEWHVNKFQLSRNRLLNANKLSKIGLTSIQIIEWLDNQKRNNQALAAAKDGEYIRTEFVPIELIEDIQYLVLLRDAVLLGEDAGLKILAGNDAALGASRRKQMKEFGQRRGKDQSEAGAEKWKLWNEEGDRLKELNPALHNEGKKSELARKIKQNLKLTETVQTISKRLK